MTVVDVWGHIQGYDASLIARDGDKWIFRIPSWATGPIVAEFWAEDDAGNISYRAGIFAITDGTLKCIRWLTTDGICTMNIVEKAEIMMDIGRACSVEYLDRPMAGIDHLRATCDVENHMCSKMEV